MAEGVEVAWGVDPSTQRVSIGWASGDGWRGVRTRSFNGALRDGARLDHIYAETYRLCGELVVSFPPPRLVLVEQPFGRNVPPVSYLAMAAIMVAAVRATGATVRPVPPPTWKRDALGKGDATKDEVLAWARSTAGYTGELYDESDALAIAEAALKATCG